MHNDKRYTPLHTFLALIAMWHNTLQMETGKVNIEVINMNGYVRIGKSTVHKILTLTFDCPT